MPAEITALTDATFDETVQARLKPLLSTSGLSGVVRAR